MRKSNSQFITKFLTESGSYVKNSTYYGFVELDQYFCLVIAEGFDLEGGEESAKLAAEAAMNTFVQKPSLSSVKLKRCLKKAHAILLEQSVRIHFKASLFMLVSDYTRFRYITCGNVLFYLIRDNNVWHQNTTHTIYQNLIDQEKLSPDGLKQIEESANLYYYLGGSPRSSVSSKFLLKDEDFLFFCTESFWSKVSKIEVVDAVEAMKSEEEFLGDLQELLLRESEDNVKPYCLAAVNIKKVYKEKKSLRKKIILIIMILFLVLLIVGIVFYIIYKNKEKKQEELRSTFVSYETSGDEFMERFCYDLAKQQYEKALETTKEISSQEEKLEKETLILDKTSLNTLLEQAEAVYEQKDYTKARKLYKETLLEIRKYSELTDMEPVIKTKQKQISLGMEVESLMESASLKEAEGTLRESLQLYQKAEAMLRILEDPELLQEAMLAVVRVKDRLAEQETAEKKVASEEVVLVAEKVAALDAILSQDYAAAIALYTTMRDAYLERGEDEKAKELTDEIVLLKQQEKRAATQVQEQEAAAEKKKAKEEKAAAALDEEKEKMAELKETVLDPLYKEAMEAMISGDLEQAIIKYGQILQLYITLDDVEMAEQIKVILIDLREKVEQEKKILEEIETELETETKEPSESDISPTIEIVPQ